jgi:hypothetical protein
MILGPSIAPGQSIATTGTWEPTGTRGPGSYRLVIGGKVTLPILIAGSAPSPPEAPSPLMPTPGSTPVVPGGESLPMPSTEVPAPPALPTPTVPSRTGGSGPSTTHTVPTSNPPTTGQEPLSAPVAGSAHIPFENCSAKNVTVTISLPGRSFVQPSVSKKPVPYQVTLRNAGDTPCGEEAADSPPVSRVLYVGPCGALSADVYNVFGVNVYPGDAAFSCPAFGESVYLPAHGTLTASDHWIGYTYLAANPDLVAQYQPAPPGPYRLVVGTVPVGGVRARVVTVPFTLVAADS